MINNELKKISGVVLAIGLNDKEQTILEKNSKIEECYLLNSNSYSSNFTKGYSKTINIRKIKRIFRKKSFDYIIANFEELKPYLRTFIKNSIYLNKGITYFYDVKDFDKDELKKRYVRYNSKVEIKKNSISVNNEKAKTNIVLNLFYYVCDLIYDVVDYVGNIFIS